MYQGIAHEAIDLIIATSRKESEEMFYRCGYVSDIVAKKNQCPILCSFATYETMGLDSHMGVAKARLCFYDYTIL